MQELIEHYRARKENATSHEERIYYQGVLNKATELLEKEKEQLIHAFLCGDDAVFHFNRPEDFKTFIDYYTQTFTQ